MDKAKDALSSIMDESSKYANTVIMIIIFLIFLNLFMTTYFYFTSLITANANRSNCGAGGLTEAETFRHIFLQDNGNDKTRDIYIIIVAIFAIYMFSEMFKAFEMSDLDGDFNYFQENSNWYMKLIQIIPGVLFVVIGYFITTKMYISGGSTHFNLNYKKYNSRENIIHWVSTGCLGFIFLLLVLDYFDFDFTKGNKISKGIKIVFIVLMLAIMIIESILSSNYNIFTTHFEWDGTKLINPKFNANIAMIMIFSAVCILCAIHTFKYGFNQNNFVYYLLLLLFMMCLFMFILMSSLDLNIGNGTFKGVPKGNDIGGANSRLPSNLIYMFWLLVVSKWTALVVPFIIFLFLKSDEKFIKILVFYYVLLFVLFLFYVYFMNKESTTGILSLQYFQLYNFYSEMTIYENEKKTNLNENYYKRLNVSNFVFIFIFLVILFIIFFKSKDQQGIILPIIVFIIASYVTGIVYLIYNKIFPIQQLSFDYKKNLIDINNEISNHIKTVDKEHTIDKDKIFNFNTFSVWSEVTTFKDTLHAEPAKTKKEKLELIKNEFRKIAPKGENYDKYVDQSKDQKEYEEYILNIFDGNVSESDGKIFSKIDTKHYDTDAEYNKKIIEYLTAENKNITTILNDSSITAGEKTDRIINQQEFTDFYTTLNTDTIRKATPEYKTILLDILTKQYSDVKSSLSDEIQNIIKKSDSDTEYTKAIQAINNKIILINNIETLTPNEIKTINAIISNIMNMILSKTNEELKLEIYRKLIIDVPKDLNEITDNNDIKYFNTSAKLDIPVANNLEYIIKKNYKYVTGEEGEIQKYQDNVLNGLYWIKIPNDNPNANGFKIGENIYSSDTVENTYVNKYNAENKYNVITVTTDDDREFYFYTSELTKQNSKSNEFHKPDIAAILNTQTTDPNEKKNMDEEQKTGKRNKLENVFETITIDDTHTIYRMKDYFFEKVKSEFEKAEEKDIHFFALNVYPSVLNLFVSYNIINTSIETTNLDVFNHLNIYKDIKMKEAIYYNVKEPVFYTIGYDYNNYKSDDNNNQVILRDKLYALPAKYYACAYLNYHPKSDESMNTRKFKDYIDEKHYEIYNPDKNNIVTKIAKSYNTIVEDAKKDLDPKKFYFLLIFLVILAILLLMYFFNLVKVYIPDTEYSPQMYVLGILAVFLTVFIFGEVIFSRIK